ncbi:MAG: hypothetical protein JJ975_00295 [Bacteroidia bacterium]|nr:hypothetical protein [Bacteroidia bacterium]
MWFKELVGFEETSPEKVREHLSYQDGWVKSEANGREMYVGILEVPTLDELKQRAPSLDSFHSRLRVKEVVGNVQALHVEPQNEHSVFQAASQFNLLEMVSPSVTPEMGIDRYSHDHTQGPACAIACGAGTIYRNYFVPLNGKQGQTRNNQINCLDQVGEALNNSELQLWSMVNGYALLNEHGLLKINALLGSGKVQRDTLKSLLRVGVQWNTEVTIAKEGHQVTQVYCSALPVAYSSHIDPIYWENFATLILEATYEATLYTALINHTKTGCSKVFLTLVGGGAFGNELSWILSALSNALIKFRNTPLNVSVVSYGHSNRRLHSTLEKLLE